MRKAVVMVAAVAVALAGCGSSQSVPEATALPPGLVLTQDAQARATEQAGLPQGPGMVRGVVYDMDGAPLHNVLVYASPERMALTAEDGSYRFEVLEYGEQKISVLSHGHIDAADGQTAFVYEQADITRDFHLAPGLDTNMHVTLLNESEEALSGTVGFFRLNDLKQVATAESAGDAVDVTLPAGDYWVETVLQESGDVSRGALLSLPPNRVREGALRLYREPERELQPAEGALITVAGTMTPPEGCTATAYAVQAVDRDSGRTLGAVFSTDGQYEINFSAEGTEGRYLIRYDAVCSRTLVAADVLPLTLEPGEGGHLSFNPVFDAAQ